MNTTAGRSRRGLGRYAVVATLVVVLIVTTVVVIKAMGRPNLHSTAKSIAHCVSTSDSPCLALYVSEDERLALGLNGEQLEKLVTFACGKLGLPRTYKVSPSDPDIEHYGYGKFDVQGRNDQGYPIGFSLHLAYTDEAIQSPNLVSSMLIASWRGDVRPLDASTRAEASLRRIMRGLDEDLPRLRELGMKGLIFHEEQISLQAFRDYCKEAIEGLRAKP